MSKPHGDACKGMSPIMGGGLGADSQSSADNLARTLWRSQPPHRGEDAAACRNLEEMQLAAKIWCSQLSKIRRKTL